MSRWGRASERGEQGEHRLGQRQILRKMTIRGNFCCAAHMCSHCRSHADLKSCRHLCLILLSWNVIRHYYVSCRFATFAPGCSVGGLRCDNVEHNARLCRRMSHSVLIAQLKLALGAEGSHVQYVSTVHSDWAKAQARAVSRRTEGRSLATIHGSRNISHWSSHWSR